MDCKLTINKIEGKGRGVFAGKRINQHVLIESCPIILIKTPKSPLPNYTFRWTKNTVALALGYGSLYNHACPSNAYYEQDRKNLSINIYAFRVIKKGEEITINYTGDPTDCSKLWFKTI
jgi:SET domain-containing protein